MRLECSLSIASTRRSKKRRRSEAAPMNSPSIAGVSHTMRIWSPKAVAELTGSRSMRQRRLTVAVRARRVDAGAERGEPQRALDLRRHRPGAVALVVGDIFQRGAPQAAARRQERDRLDAIGLAGPVRPDQRHHVSRRLEPRRPIIAKMRQRQALNAGGGHFSSVIAGHPRSQAPKTWMAGTSPAMTYVGNARRPVGLTPASASARTARSCRPCPAPASASRGRRACSVATSPSIWAAMSSR